MRKYAVIDLQGTSFMSYTHDEPMSRKELIEHFKGFCDIEGFKKGNANTLKQIKEFWELQFVSVN